MGNSKRSVVVLVNLLQICAAATHMTPHPVTIYSLEGEALKGEYRFEVPNHRNDMVVPTGLELETLKIDDEAKPPDVIDISNLKIAKG
jgi:hypothetical protein